MPDWSEQEKRELIALRDAGYSFLEIGIKIGRTRSMVAGQMNRLGERSRSGRVGHKFTAGNKGGVPMSAASISYTRSWPPERTARVKELYDAGVSMTVIAVEIGMDWKAVKRCVEREKWPAREKPKRFVLQHWDKKPSERKPPTPIRADDGTVGVPLRDCDGCRWPVNSWRLGNGFEARFCGAERVDDSKVWYCEGHVRVAFRVAA